MKRRFEIDVEGLPDLPGMMLVTIEALKDLGGSATIRELDEKVADLEAVTEAEQAFTMSVVRVRQQLGASESRIIGLVRARG